MSDTHGQHTNEKEARKTHEKKDEGKPVAITATLLANLDAKECKRITAEAQAIADGVRTVRDMGNAPGNVMTPTRIGERAEEVAKSVGVKCTVYDKRAIEKMKMGGLLAVNKGSAEEPRRNRCCVRSY